MCRTVLTMIVVWVAFSSAIEGQTAFAIRAAARNPVTGWQQVASPDGSHVLWVDPTKALTSTDVERAQSTTMSDGSPAVAIRFTDDGAKKIAELFTPQVGQPMAFLLDGNLIWAPTLLDPIGKEAVLSGGPGGMTSDEIARLLVVLQPR